MISVLIVIGIAFSFIHGVNPYVERKQSCGVDNSKSRILYEGIADIHTYPWMGTLFYPFGKKKLTTSVVLVTKQIVIGAADEIDFLPKEDVRARSRVVLGHKCSGPFLRVRDYAFHPDYKRESYTALAMIQLDVDAIQHELRPICGPPAYFAEPKIYAMVNGHCKEGKVRVYKMEFVPQDKCEQYYRKSGLGLQKFWPKHSACAQTESGGTCRWRSGTALVMKQDGRWRLLGFGVNGPGCEAPARFLDYGMHQQWVRNSVARIGRPAITRITDNHIVMRRTLNNLQRYGDCDHEERRYVIYKDLIEIEGDKTATTTYNGLLADGFDIITAPNYFWVVRHTLTRNPFAAVAHKHLPR